MSSEHLAHIQKGDLGEVISSLLGLAVFTPA